MEVNYLVICQLREALNVKTDDVYDGIDELITEQVVTDNFEEGLA